MVCRTKGYPSAKVTISIIGANSIQGATTRRQCRRWELCPRFCGGTGVAPCGPATGADCATFTILPPYLLLAGVEFVFNKFVEVVSELLDVLSLGDLAVELREFTATEIDSPFGAVGGEFGVGHDLGS